MSDTDEDELDSPGWDAIDKALKPLYGQQQPLHWGTLISHRLGGPDPLDGISAYRNAAPRPHWHFVSYGMSELYAKESENKEFSGWGFEFTFRLVRPNEEEQPPAWTLNFIQNLARYVCQSGNIFQPGDHMDINGPLTIDIDTQIRALLFAADPQLPTIDTPNGQVSFVQIVGVTLDELRAAKSWNATGFLDILSQKNPMLLTDLTRGSILSDPAVASLLAAKTREEGSSTGFLYASNVQFREGGWLRKTADLTFGAQVVNDLVALLPARIPHGRPLTIRGKEQAVLFERADSPRWSTKGDTITIGLSSAAVHQIASSVRPKQGRYLIQAIPGLSLHIVPSQIRDHEGKVVQVIGE